MKGKPLQSEELLYFKAYFDDIEGFKSKITENMRSIENIIRIFQGVTAHTAFKTLMSLQKNS